MNIKCLLGHKWGKWVDTAKVNKVRLRDNALVATGVQQKRHCERCGRLEIRSVWS